MKFTVSVPSWRRLKGKAEDRVSQVRLEREIRDLQEEIDLQMQMVGEIMYAAHRGSPAESEDIQRILEYVDGLYEEMEAHLEEILPAAGLNGAE
ncbi:MAG: hypothetical protein K2O45_17400 [Oscillospiraceae bacterium]|nr:hypothetical protein [Oscillospiraceae bacterium]